MDSNNRCPPPPPLLLDDDAVTTGLNWFLLGADWLLVVPGDGEGPGTWIDVFMAVCIRLWLRLKKEIYGNLEKVREMCVAFALKE